MIVLVVERDHKGLRRITVVEEEQIAEADAVASAARLAGMRVDVVSALSLRGLVEERPDLVRRVA